MIVVNARFLAKKVTGLERYAAELSIALKKYFPDVKFVSHKGDLNTELAKELNLEVFGLLKGHLWEQIELPRYLKKKKSPILLSPVNTGPIYFKNQIPIIHDLAFLRHPEWYSKSAAIFFKFIVSKVAQNSSHILTVSEFSKSEIITLLKIPEEKITVISCAVPQKIIELSKNEYKNKYGNFILTVATIEPRKNLKNLINAFLQLNQKDLKLIVVGNKNNRVFSNPELSNITNHNIIFTGYVSDEELVGLYKNTRLFIYPSLYEGFGLPPLEAFFCNSNLLVSDIKPLKETFGDKILYFNPESVNDIANKIEELLNVSMNTNKQLINNLTWQQISSKTFQIIKMYYAEENN